MINFLIGFFIGLLMSQITVNYWPLLITGVAVYWFYRIIKAYDVKL